MSFWLICYSFFQSHKEYTIVSYILDKDDNKIDRIEIRRRYSDFEWLVNQLTTKYPAFIIPPLPEKNPLGKIYNEDAEFIENRQKGLLYFLNKMLEHPALRNTNDFVQFLTAYDTVIFSFYFELLRNSSTLSPKNLKATSQP